MVPGVRSLVRVSLLVCAVLTSIGCVPQSRYDLALQNAKDREREGDVARAEVLELRKSVAGLQSESEERNAKLVAYEEQISKDSRKLAELEKKLETLTNTNTEVGERLRIASMTLTELANERQRLTLAANDTRACLDALQAARARVQNAPVVRASSATTTTTAATAGNEPSELERCVQRAMSPAAPPAASGQAPAAPPRN